MAADASAMSVELRANFRDFERRLQGAQRQTDRDLSRIEGRFRATNDNLSRSLRGGFGTLFTNGLNGITGAAPGAIAGIDKLGMAGMAATAVAGAMALAWGKAVEAMSFGDELQAQADKIGISAEALQELGYAADEADVDADKLRAGLEKLNGAIGAMQTGIGAKKLKPVFEELGITPEQLARAQTADDLLGLIADRINQVGSTAAQVQIARKLGIEDLLPLLREGSDGLDEMRQRAHELGLVLSNETVKSLAEADRQMELASQQINMNLRGAFAGLAQDIAGATGHLAAWLLKLEDIKREAPKVFEVFSRAMRAVPFLASTAAMLRPGAKPADANVPGGASWADIAAAQRRQREAAAEFLGNMGPAPARSARVSAPRATRAPKVEEERFTWYHNPETVDWKYDVQEAEPINVRLDIEPAELAEISGDLGRGMLETIEEQRERFREFFTSTVGGGIRAALDGDLSEFFEDWLKDRAAAGLESALNTIADAIFNSRGGGGGGGWLSYALDLGASLMGGGSGGGNANKIAGFATGGSFRVGGSGGIDSKLVTFRATPGEMVDVRRPGSERGGMSVQVVPSPYFDVRVRQVAAPLVGAAAQQTLKATPGTLARYNSLEG